MMGRLSGAQVQLFYAFRLEDRVPSGHLLRLIDGVLDLGDLRRLLAPFYSHTGRPSIDPELMMRMLIVGYCFGIRSERRLCEDVSLNLAYRWFCRLGLEDQVPDHSTFGKNRHGRFRDSDLFRQVFETVVRRCIVAGLVGGEGFAVDASVIEADASRFKRVAGAEADWSSPARQTRAIEEYLAALDSDHSPIIRSASRVPCHHRTLPRRGRPKAACAYSSPYGLNYLIDDKHAVILDVEATPARISKEVASTKLMITRTQQRLGLKPKHLVADSAYGRGGLLGWLVDRGIDPHIPVWDKSERADGTLSRADFAFDAEHDFYVCPQGKILASTGRVHDGRTLYYRSRKHDCDRCALKQRCCPKGPFRRIPRDVNEHGRDHARSLADTQEFEDSSRRRKKIEMLFAHLKRQLGFERLRLRGPSGARDEFLLAATVQNLRRLARFTNQLVSFA
jgi:transposase